MSLDSHSRAWRAEPLITGYRRQNILGKNVSISISTSSRVHVINVIALVHEYNNRRNAYLVSKQDVFFVCAIDRQ